MRLETERLILRHWRDEDRPIYAGYCADPQTRRYYPDLLTAEQTNANIDRYIASLAADGFGYLAVERKDNGAFLGDVGLSRVGDTCNPEDFSGIAELQVVVVTIPSEI